MKINQENIKNSFPLFQQEFIDLYRPPETLGAPKGKKEKATADACFKPVEGMLAKAYDSMCGGPQASVVHSFRYLADEGIPVFPGYTTLCGLAQNGLIRSGVEMRAKEMTRKWGKLTATDEADETIEALTREMERFKIRETFRAIAEQCGFLGGCLVYIQFDDALGKTSDPVPLDSTAIKDGYIKGFKIIDPWVCYPGIYNSINPLADDYFKPSVWYVQGIPVSSTRIIRFTENELPDMIKPAYNFFGLSLSQKVLDAVAHFTRNRESASKLLEKVSLVVLKTNMENILSGGIDNNMDMRLLYFAQGRDSNGVAVIDKESEDLAIFNNSLSGVVDIVRQSMEYVAAMFNEPATKLWGISPAGMNATGESDMKNHYDNIASLQEQMFRPGLDKILQLLQLNMGREIDTSIKFQFESLSDEADKILAESNKMKAETCAVYEEMGAISATDVRNALIKDPQSGFNDLEPYSIMNPPPKPNELNIDI